MEEHKLEQLAFERLNQFLNSRKIQIKWNSDSNVFVLADLKGEHEVGSYSELGWRSVKDVFFHGDYVLEESFKYTTNTFFEVCDIWFNITKGGFNLFGKVSQMLAEISRKFQPIKSYSSYEELLIKMDLVGI